MTTDTQGRDLVERRVKQRLEPNWLRDLRLAALTSYEQLPAVRWEKSDLGKRKSGPFAPVDEDVSCPDTWELETHFDAHADKIVFANDKRIEASIPPALAEQGVFFGDLSFAVRLFPHLVKPYLGRLVPHESNKWVALQTALWDAGVLLYVPRNVRVTVPLQAWWHRTVGGGRLHPRLLVVAEEGSEVTLLTGEVSLLPEPAFSVQVAEVYAKANARVRIASLQEQDAQMTRLAYWRAQVERDAEVDFVFAEAGAGYAIADVTSNLVGDGARSLIHSVTLGHGTQHLDMTHRAVHHGRHTESRIRGNRILSEQARTICRAVSQIEKGAVGTNSTQEERMILLSQQAQVNPIPMLLIAEEEVRCDHAVSVGTIPADQLFYLMARGLNEADAKCLLLRGFLTPLLTALPIPGLQAAVDTWTERKMAL